MRQMMAMGALMALTGCVAPDSGGYRPNATSASRGCDTSFQVVNASSRTVEAFHFGPSSQQSWGPDRLGRATLPPGGSTGFRAANGGPHDFQAVWRGGQSVEAMRVDVCRVNRVTVTNGGLRVS